MDKLAFLIRLQNPMLLKKTEILAERNPHTTSPSGFSGFRESSIRTCCIVNSLGKTSPLARCYSLPVFLGPPVHLQTAKQRVTDTGYLLYELRHELLPLVTLTLTTFSTAIQCPLSLGFPKDYNVKHCSSKV